MSGTLTAKTPGAEFLESLKSDFANYLAQAGDTNFVNQRKQAFDLFLNQGLPTPAHEEWKYTNLRKAYEANLATTCLQEEGIADLLASSVLNGLDAYKLVFVNGCFQPQLSALPQAGDLVLLPLSEARKQHAATFDAHFGKYIPLEGYSLNALNTALMSDGAFVQIKKNKKADKPVILFQISDSSLVNAFSQPRNLVIVEEGADLHLIESFLSNGNGTSFTNAVTEVMVDKNAHLEHYKLQRQSDTTYLNHFTQIHQEADTSINHVTLTLSGNMVRNNLHFYMNGRNCNSLLYGLYITDGNEFVDNHTRVDHAMPDCFSDEKYKGILKDQSTAVFNGKIMVHLDAQKTNAYQRNQNILLSKDAVVNTKPQLEIFADDVKCTHGATIGQLDEEPLFYLRSRGIPENEARKLLLNAFADDIAEKIRIPELVQVLEDEIARKIS